MSATTSRLQMYLPGGGSTGLIQPDETADIDKLNENFRKIDAAIGARNLPSASTYAGALDGDLIYAQDTKLLQMYSADVGALVNPKFPGSNYYKGTKAQRDAFTEATEGDHWQLTDDNKMEYVYIGSKWKFTSPGLVPIIPGGVNTAAGTIVVSDTGAIDFTNATDMRLVDVFTDEFDDYRFSYQITAASSATASNIVVRFGKAGAVDVSSNYYRAGLAVSGSGAGVNWGSASGVDYILAGMMHTSWFPAEGTFEIKNPARAGRRTHMTGQGMGLAGTVFGNFNIAGMLNKDDAVTLMQVLPSAGNISGTMRMYGYAK